MKVSSPSIVDGKLVRVSVSQIEAYRACPRKWAFDKVFKLPRPEPSDAITIGVEGHARIEKYLLTGEDIRQELESTNPLIDKYIKYAPFNGGSGLVEASLENPEITIGGAAVAGFIDFFIPDYKGMPLIIDHKFKGSISKYGLKESDLEADTQGNVYAWWAMSKVGADDVMFAHHSYQTKGKPLAKETTAILHRESVKAKVDELSSIVKDEMSLYAGCASQDDIPFKESSCSAYGGCPYAGVCSASPQNRYKNLFAVKKEGNMKVKECKLQEKYSFEDGQTGTFRREMGGLYKFVTDDEVWFSKRAEDNAYPPGQAPEKKPAVKEEKSNIPDIVRPEVKAKKPETKPAAKIGIIEPTPQEIVAVQTETLPKVLAPKVDGLVLLVDVTLARGGEDLSMYVQTLHLALCKKFKVEDVRLADPQGPLGFGKWKALMGLMARENPPTGICFIQRSELADPVIEALRPLAVICN
jgi:hypothetical protein